MTKNKYKLNNKISISIIISIAIVVLSIIYIIVINTSDNINQFQAQRGIMDLNNWEGNKNIYLEGEWEFYPNVLLTPEDDINQYEDIKKYVEVPGTWEAYLNDDGSVDGSGTYRLKINLPKDDTYGIKSRTIRYSSRIFINEEEIISVGNPSTDIKNYVAKEKNEIGFSHSENQELDLIINVSSYNYTSGGITNQIIFGTFDSILKQDRIDRTISAISITLSLGLGLFFIATYFQRNRNKELLYIGIAYFFMGLYMGSLNEQLLDLIIDYNFITRTRIQLACVMLIVPSILKFAYHFFEEYVNKQITNIIIGLNIFSMGLAIVTMKSSFITLEFSQISVLTTTLIAFLNLFYILLKAILSKDESSGYILIISSSLFAMWFGMMVTILYEMEQGKMGIVNIMIIMISISILITNKLQSDYKKVQLLSLKLLKDDKLKDEFLARASHELSTPLHVILNSSQALIEGKKGPLNSDQQENLLFINQEGKRLSRLVEDLLNASNIKKGEINFRFSPINVYRTVENILREMDILIPEEKDIVLINDVPESLPVINSDSDKFTQIIYNLVNNSINYTKSGEIRVSASQEGEYISFEVKDTGIGISEEDMGEIFKVFYKKNDSKNPGMGIGLPITKRLVEILAGEIDLESTYGQGSIFRFTIPINENEITNEETINPVDLTEIYEPTLKPPTDYFIDKPTILISDDRISNQKVLVDILEGSGYNLLLAKNGAETLEVLKKYNVDLIVLDFMMPDMSGAEVSKEIRKKYSLVELPIIMLTASGKSIDFKNAFEFGANDFIKKPADAQELVTRINSLLEMKDSVREGLKKEFQYFYSQISPHFLYNTMNTIIGLSYKDVEASRKAMNNLSIYFRGKLDLYKDKTLIPLEEEMELVRAYLEIEQLRYGPRLNVEIDIEEDLDIYIPPMTIQPLVENAIGHGISVKKDGGCVRIRARSHEDSVIISIEDDGVGISEEKQKDLMNGETHRLGFNNIIEKLKIMKDASLELESQESVGTKIKITIKEVNYYEGYTSR